MGSIPTASTFFALLGVPQSAQRNALSLLASFAFLLAFGTVRYVDRCEEFDFHMHGELQEYAKDEIVES